MNELAYQILVTVPKLNMSPQFGPHTLQNINKIEMTPKRAATSHRTTGCFDDRLLTMMTDTGFYVQ